jgi:hypothetical protein
MLSNRAEVVIVLILRPVKLNIPMESSQGLEPIHQVLIALPGCRRDRRLWRGFFGVLKGFALHFHACPCVDPRCVYVDVSKKVANHDQWCVCLQEMHCLGVSQCMGRNWRPCTESWDLIYILVQNVPNPKARQFGAPTVGKQRLLALAGGQQISFLHILCKKLDRARHEGNKASFPPLSRQTRMSGSIKAYILHPHIEQFLNTST